MLKYAVMIPRQLRRSDWIFDKFHGFHCIERRDNIFSSIQFSSCVGVNASSSYEYG